MSSEPLGRSLRKAREARGLTVEQLSRETTIPVRDIEALECDAIDSLPRAMYRRAEARAYAEAVGLDADVVLSQLRRGNGAATAPREQPPQTATAAPIERNESAAASRRNRHAAPARAMRALVVLAIGCGALLWQHAGAPDITMAVAPAATLPAVDASTLLEQAIRIVEPPPPTPTLQSVLFSPRPAATGQRWSRDGRLDEGVLVVHSTPRGARVTVNGVGWGVTPVAIRYLPLGTLRVRVGKSDYVTEERIVHLTPTNTTRELRLSLNELRRRRTTAPATAGGDMLVITSVPEGARVTVNGIGWGTTPLAIRHLPGGEQRVRVVKDQFRSEERVVTVHEGQGRQLSVTLKPLS
jgi:hypothetical protein